MFTPHSQRARKGPWTPIASGAPSTVAGGRLNAASKGKTVAFVDGPSQPLTPSQPQPTSSLLPPPPPLGSLTENNVASVYDDGSMEDWRRFKEAGLLDESSMERKDRAALVQRVSKLEKELYDYQHSMGILLLENEKLTSRCGELEHSVAEATEILKREQRAHLIAISEAESREENMKKALDLERKCVADLETALREMRNEHEQIKHSSESTITSTKVRMAQIEDERLEVEGKLFSANAKIAEADTKIVELDMKLKEVENRENTLHKQRQSLEADQAAHEASSRRQKEDLVEWERKLQEREERLCQNRRTLNEREEKLHQSNRSCQQKENELEQIQKKIDSANDTLKQLEDDLNRRMEDIVSKEEKAEALRSNMEMREKQLLAMEERLSAKEKVELQKLLDEHQAISSNKMLELEMEMEQNKNSLDEEFKTKLQGLEKKELEINHQEAKLVKWEESLEKKSERIKEKGKDIEEKSKALKDREKHIKDEENKVDLARTNLSSEKESLLSLRNDIETLREKLRKEEVQIDEQSKKLKITEQMRSEHVRLQSNLKLEMEKWRQQNELLTKQLEDLRQDRANFERDWDALDDKRDSVEKELKKIEEHKESFERFRRTEEEKLKKEKIEMEARIKQELESVKLEKETFATKMKHEQLMLAENTRNKHDQMVQEFEQRRRKLENDVSKRQEELEKRLQEKEREFEDSKQKEMSNINHLKELAKMQGDELEFYQQQLENDRQEVSVNKKQLEQDRLEIGKDIEALSALSRRLKGQREQLLGERARFLDLIKKLEVCDTCGESTRDFIFSDLHLPTLEEKEVGPSSHLSGQYLRKTEFSPDAANLGASDSGGQKSWLRKCASKIFKLSPSKRGEHSSLTGSPNSALQPTGDERSSAQNVPLTVEWKLEPHASENKKSEHSARILDAVNVQSVEFSDKVIVEAAIEGPAPANDPKNNDNVENEVPEESEQSSRHVGSKPRTKSTGSGVRRTRSVKQVVVDAETILGKTLTMLPEIKDNDEAPGNSSQVGKQSTARKRGRAKSSVMSENEQNDIDSGSEMADSVSTVGRKKRRQTATAVLPPTPGEKRYNLRRRKTSGTQRAPEVSDAPKSCNNIADDSNEDAHTSAQSDEEYDPALSLEVNGDNGSSRQGPLATTESVEYLSDRVVRFKMPAGNTDNDIVDAGKSEENAVARMEMPPVDDTSMHDEVNYTAETAEEDESSFYENGNEGDNSDDSGDGDGNEGSPHQLNEASIGKLLWKFLTT